MTRSDGAPIIVLTLMRGYYGILLIAVLVAVSGFIAYVGDLLGRGLGRRRVSIFGLRPRHTAMAISVLAGMLIAAWTLGVAMGVSRDVRDAFTRVVEFRRQVGSLGHQAADLRRQRYSLVKQANASRDAAHRAQAESAKAEVQRAEAQKALDRQQRELASVSRKLAEKSKELSRATTVAFQRTAESIVARKKVRSLEDEGKRLEQEISELTGLSARAFRALTTPLIAHANEPLLSIVIDATQPKQNIRRSLRELVESITHDAQARGADGVRAAVSEAKTGKVNIGPSQVAVEVLTPAIAEAGDSVVVQAVSLLNTAKGETLLVGFRLFRNKRVFQKGDIIAETTIDASFSEAKILASLVSLLRDDVGPRARAHGVLPAAASSDSSRPLLPSADMPVGEVSVEELLALARQIQKTGGQVRVVARALADAWTAGPLKVELAVAAS